MFYARCPRCKKYKLLTKHSKVGNHLPPYEYICRKCHDIEHGIEENLGRKYRKTHSKYSRGTNRSKRKKKR